MLASSVPGRWSRAAGRGDPSQPPTAASIKLPSLPVRPLVFKRLFPDRLRLLLTGLKHTLLAASDALMCVQSFQDELRRRDLLFRSVLRRHAQRSEFLHQSLDALQILQSLRRRNRIRELNLAAQIEPLYDLLHVGAGKVLVVGLRDRCPDQFPPDEIGALHFSFVLQFE